MSGEAPSVSPAPAAARRRANLSAVLLDANPALAAGAPALRFEGGEWTHPQLANAAGRAAAWLRRAGVGRGDVVLIALPDSPEWVALFLGVARVGGVCALAGHGLGAERLRRLAEEAGAALVAHDGPSLGVPVPELDPGWIADVLAEPATDPGPAPVAGSDPCYLLLTSGSTGQPKWVVHRHADIPACLATYGRRVLRLRPSDVTWSHAALCTSYGLGNSLYFPLGAGACAWIEPGPRTPAAAARACLVGGVTVLFGVPTGWARLARHVSEGRVERAAFAGVRLAVSAGEPLSARTWRSVERELGLRLVNGLGCSEASNLYLSDRPGAPRPGTVGHPVAGFQLRVCPSGELLVRGPSVMAGYLGDPQATAHALRDSWLCTGDLVRRERDGSYTFLGRRDDRFKAGASWVEPRRVEAALEGEPDVAAARAFGAPDRDGVVRVAAIVAAPRPDAGLAARVQRRCETVLEPHERPRAILVLDELPVAGSGKLDWLELRRLAITALAGGVEG